MGELTALYDDRGNLKELRYGSSLHQFQYAGPRNQLEEWISVVEGKETKTRFEYENALLVRVTQGGVVQRELQWEEIPGGLEADTEWPAPVRVCAIGKLHFSYDLDYKGFAMVVKVEGSSDVQKRVLNPNRGLVDVIENGKFDRRIFYGVRRSQPDAGKVTRIEDGQQRLIAKYTYDSYGRVSSYWTGEGNENERIDFIYDQTGRHRKTTVPSPP